MMAHKRRACGSAGKGHVYSSEVAGFVTLIKVELVKHRAASQPPYPPCSARLPVTNKSQP